MPQIAEIIKYEGDNSTFIWKHPCEDFNSLTQLIVHESQEAIFFMNGQALDLFGAGRYTLETQNIPLIGKALNRATGDVSTRRALVLPRTVVILSPSVSALRRLTVSLLSQVTLLLDSVELRFIPVRTLASAAMILSSHL